MPVEKGVEHAIESHQGRSVDPPRDREVNHREEFGRYPRQRNRHKRQEKRNYPPLVRVCAVAVHTSPARLIEAEQASVGLLSSALHPMLLPGGARENN